MRKLALLIIAIVLMLPVVTFAGCGSDNSYDASISTSPDGEGGNEEGIEQAEEYADHATGQRGGQRGGQRSEEPVSGWWNDGTEARPGYARFIDGRFFSTELTGFDLSYLEFSSENMAQNVLQLQYMTNLTELRLWHSNTGDLTPLSGLTNLTVLSLGRNHVSDLTPLADLTNLTHLFLFGNEIRDLTPLSGLTNLTHLSLFDNEISDLTPLSTLVNLTVLELSSNQISDLTPLAGLTNLQELTLCDNRISDISPLDTLTNLRHLSLNGNPISDTVNFNIDDGISVAVGEFITFGDRTWQVLEVQDNHALIITENSFRAGLGQFNNRYTGVTWEASFVRHYLNGEFLHRFSPAERLRIRETFVSNDNNPWFHTDGGNDTMDRIFLLSISEVVAYFGDSGQLGDSEISEWWGGIYDDYNAVRRTADVDGLYAWVWLRSRGGMPTLGTGVDGVGAIAIYDTGVSNTAGRVRPVLWLYLGEST